ncbi:unnamed protein product, partial [Symbiodinium sp. CCMP2592]
LVDHRPHAGPLQGVKPGKSFRDGCPRVRGGAPPLQPRCAVSPPAGRAGLCVPRVHEGMQPRGGGGGRRQARPRRAAGTNRAGKGPGCEGCGQGPR